MTAEQWRRISAIFAVAQDLGDAERAAYLEAACAGHPEDRAQLESLLAQHDVEPEPAPAGPFAVGQQVGNYRVVRRLKPGGMGILYVAEDNLRREVVLKVLAPEWARDHRQRVRLRHEAEAMARLQHPGIAAVYAFEDVGDTSFLVSEYVRGRDLRERLDAEGPLDPAALADLALAVADALGAAHRAGIIHRDLKPENIMLAESGAVKLVDFGIARVDATDAVTRTNLTGAGALIGTPAYMTPEQLQGQRVDHRSDLFALGVVLYEAGTGAHPFAGRTRATTMLNILQLEQPPLGTRRPLPFGALETVVARCLRKAPDQRYPSADALIDDLRAAREQIVSGRVATPGRLIAGPEVDGSAWWWRFHQVTVSVVDGLLLIPMWLLHQGLDRGPLRDLLFFGALATAVISILMRFHAAFVARHLPTTLAAARRRIRPVVRVTESLLAALLLVGALLAREGRPGLSALLLTGGLAILVTLLVIEPATERSAFSGEPEP